MVTLGKLGHKEGGSQGLAPTAGSLAAKPLTRSNWEALHSGELVRIMIACLVGVFDKPDSGCYYVNGGLKLDLI